MTVSVLLAVACRAGSVQTIDGKTRDGDLRLENGQLIVSPTRGNVTRLDLADVLTASFKSNDAPKHPAPANVSSVLDRVWKTQDVGPTGTAGSVSVVGSRYAVKGAGANIKGPADSFFFVYQELRGDGQVFARLDDLQIINPYEKAGVMIRESFNERGSKTAFMFLTPGDGSSFAWRSEKGGEMSSTPLASADKPPAWLRLTRVKNTITAYKSMDGSSWTPVGQPQEIRMDPRVYVGLAVCSRDANAACAATFDGVTVRYGLPKDDAPPKLDSASGTGSKAVSSAAAAPAAEALLHRAIVLRNGSVIGNIRIQSADDKTVRVLRADGKPAEFSTSEVARLVLGPVSAQHLARIPPAGTGVLLGRGDFFEGEFESLKDGRVRVNSIVFGPRELIAGSEAVVVVLHEPGGGGGAGIVGGSQVPWVVRTNDGFVYMARSARIEKDRLIVEDQAAGLVKLAAGTLSEIRAGGTRFDSLADLRPEKKDMAGGGVSGAGTYSSGPSVTLDGRPCDRAVICQAGSSLEYQLGAKYRIFLCRAGVPDGIVPTLAVRLTVLADGKEVYRSEPMTCLDDAPVVSIDVAGVGTLTLRVETAGQINLPAVAVLGDPMLVK